MRTLDNLFILLCIFQPTNVKVCFAEHAALKTLHTYSLCPGSISANRAQQDLIAALGTVTI